MRKLYATLAIVIVLGFSLIQFLLLTFSPVVPDDSEPSHYVKVWVAEANFTYWIDLGWYHTESDAEMAENQESGWGTRISLGEYTTVTGRFYRISESADFVWIRMELSRYEDGEHTFIDSTHFQLEIGVMKRVVVGGLVFSTLLSIAQI